MKFRFCFSCGFPRVSNSRSQQGEDSSCALSMGIGNVVCSLVEPEEGEVFHGSRLWRAFAFPWATVYILEGRGAGGCPRVCSSGAAQGVSKLQHH